MKIPNTSFSIQQARSFMMSGRVPKWAWALFAALVTALVIWRPWTGSRNVSTREIRSAIPVSVASAAKKDIPITLTALGTVTSLATATVKSQISGYLTEIHFTEGQMVKKGDLLAQVDPRPYQATLAQYEGQREKDQALLDNARRDLKRYQTLISQDSTSRQTLDTAAATVRQYEGTVRSDQGQIDAQKLNIAYCRITSPVEGRVGLRQVDVGNYVTPSDSSGIAVVTQLDPISVLFTLSEDSLRLLMPRLKAGASLQVTAYDRTNTERLAEGTLQTVDNQIDTTTGTIKLRAVFDNAEATLFPNLFVNVTLHVNTLHDVVAVPSSAVLTGTPGTYTYLLNADSSSVVLRKITTGPSAEGYVSVTSGLVEGDRVVIDGADHLSDGAKVRIPAGGSADISAATAVAQAEDGR